MVSLHGEPCLKSFLDGFPSVFDPSWVPIMPKWVPNCAADVPVRGERRAGRARARLVQERQLHNWDPILGFFGGQEDPKTEGNLSKLMLTHPKQPKKTTTSGPEPGFSGPRTWVWARCGHFLGGCFVRARCCHVCFDSFGRGSHQK